MDLESGKLNKSPERRRDSITVANADSVTILIAGATNYKLEWPTYKGAPVFLSQRRPDR